MGGLLIAVGGFFLLCNLVIIVRWVLFNERASLGPIVGGVALALGLLLSPLLPPQWRWPAAIAALVVDITIPMLLFVVVVSAIPPLRRRWLEREAEDPASPERASDDQHDRPQH